MEFREITKDEAAEAIRGRAFRADPQLWIARYPSDDMGQVDQTAFGPFDTRDAAVAHARTLSTDPDEGVVAELFPPGGHRYVIHSRMSGLGADHDLDHALQNVEDATTVGWGWSMFGHDLVVRGADDRVVAYDVRRPDRDDG